MDRHEPEHLVWQLRTELREVCAFQLIDSRTGYEVDRYRTRSSAEHYARALNDGRATVSPHRIVGTRVEEVRDV